MMIFKDFLEVYFDSNIHLTRAGDCATTSPEHPGYPHVQQQQDLHSIQIPYGQGRSSGRETQPAQIPTTFMT
jgi:hypothetical protein